MLLCCCDGLLADHSFGQPGRGLAEGESGALALSVSIEEGRSIPALDVPKSEDQVFMSLKNSVFIHDSPEST